jgi:hypothetical protein
LIVALPAPAPPPGVPTPAELLVSIAKAGTETGVAHKLGMVSVAVNPAALTVPGAIAQMMSEPTNKRTSRDMKALR